MSDETKARKGKTMISEELKNELISKIEAANLTNPEMVADEVLSIAETDGREAAIAEIERAIEAEPK